MWSWFWVVPSVVEFAAVVAAVAVAVAFAVDAATFAVEGSGVKVNAGSSEEMNCLKNKSE